VEHRAKVAPDTVTLTPAQIQGWRAFRHMIERDRR
jgi:hypothetical protein